MSDRKEAPPYLPRVSGGRWAISRHVRGRWIAIIENTAIRRGDMLEILRSLDMAASDIIIDTYFPLRPKKTHRGIIVNVRCPTLELLELFAHLGHTGSEVGV